MKKINSLFVYVSLIFIASSAQADTRQAEKEIEFFTSSTALKVSMPKEDWVMKQEKSKPNGGGFYYLFTSQSRSLNFSVFLDKTNQCSSGETCRTNFWSNPAPMYKAAKDTKMYEENGFHVIQFYLDSPGGFPVKQTNISAHAYRDGHWIDVHISKVGKEIPDPEELRGLLKSLTMK
jgi:hypothetical protein